MERRSGVEPAGQGISGRAHDQRKRPGVGTFQVLGPRNNEEPPRIVQVQKEEAVASQDHPETEPFSSGLEGWVLQFTDDDVNKTDAALAAPGTQVLKKCRKHAHTRSRQLGHNQCSEFRTDSEHPLITEQGTSRKHKKRKSHMAARKHGAG
jgi:hypothetical protein